MEQTQRHTHWFQLTPFVVFVGLFLVSTIFLDSSISPIFSCLVAIIYSFFTFVDRSSLNHKIAIFIEGGARPTVLSMVYIFIFTAVFTYVLKSIGGINAAVNIGLYFIPPEYILPGFFTVVGLFAVAIGSSMGTIAAFLPIGTAIAPKLGINPSMMAGIVVSGAMLGDNLSIISDTTIAATQTTGCDMKDKFRANISLVIPAFIMTVLILTYLNFSLAGEGYRDPSILLHFSDLIKVLPYGLVFITALMGFDVIAVLMGGIFLAGSIGIVQGEFSFSKATWLIVDGFSKGEGGIHEVLILALLVAGLSQIVEYNGGIAYLLERFSRRIKTKAGAEWSIALLIFLINAAVAINTVAILITGPVAQRIADKHGIEPKRTACLLDIVACICQGILPYAPQLLLAGAIAKVSSVSIIPYLHYQAAILLVLIVSILRTSANSSEQTT